MGGMLEKPVMSTVVERQNGKHFGVAVSELNGYRNSMEDAHVIHITDDWAAFCVFDGHGGDQCSKWVSDRFHKEFEKNGCPKDDAAVKELFLKIDREFLDSGTPSGTTATMCLVHKPASPGGKFQLRVVNAGDSRVLLGRRDGSIFDGGGTDSGLTTDHKPNHPSEKDRIQACGGTVEMAAGGVARLNGDLAVSRGFGDAEYKKQGPDPMDLERQPSTAAPEMGSFECDESDFVLLVCDGVSEGDFPNPQVVSLVAEQLKDKESFDTNALGAAASAVCKKAVATNSKDNVSCMIVVFDGRGEQTCAGKQQEFTPGPVAGAFSTGGQGFKKAYTEMAKRADLTLEEAFEKRYQQIVSKRAGGAASGVDEAEAEDDEDLKLLGEVPGEPGSEARNKYWSDLVQQIPRDSPTGGAGGPMGGLRQFGGIPPELLQALMGGAVREDPSAP